MSDNISLAKEVEITSFVPNENSYGSVEKVNTSSLTDGKKASSNSEDSGWNRFYGALGREITVELGECFAVDGVEAGFLHDRSKNIYCPETVGVYLSENGRDYYRISDMEAPYPASFAMAARARYSTKFAYPYGARFVKLVFAVESWVYCDEISVFGRNSDGGEATLSGSIHTDSSKDSYADRNTLGACDMPLIPFGRLGEREFRIKRDWLLPYLAYIDRSGRITDTMFDSIAFVPARTSPFGGSFAQEGSATNLEGWKYLLDELFADGVNLCALDDAVADLKKVLELPSDYKHKVYLAAPVPKISLEPFGDISGNGVVDKLITTEDCVNAYAWFVDETKRRFDRLGLKNIVIDGWLWNGRMLSREYNDNEPDFVKACVDRLKDRGYKSIFAPYFHAGYSDKAEYVGFDLTTMSIDVNFNEILSKDVEGAVRDMTALCRKYGFGSEIELHDFLANPETSKEFSRVFDTVLCIQAETGMMTDTVHLYRLSSVPGAVFFCAISTDSEIRENYDKLYRFIKGDASKSCAEPIEVIAETIIEETFVEEIVEPEIEEVVKIPVADALEETIEESVVEEAAVVEEIEETIIEETAEEPGVIEDIVEEVIEEPKIAKEHTKKSEKTEELHEPYEIKVESASPSVTNIKIDVKSEPSCRRCCHEQLVQPKETEKESDFCKKIAVGLGIAAAAGTLLLITKIIADKNKRS